MQYIGNVHPDTPIYHYPLPLLINNIFYLVLVLVIPLPVFKARNPLSADIIVNNGYLIAITADSNN